MDRAELGSLLCCWHSGQWDPVYMVGSFYISDEVYPDKEIVQEALSSLETTLDQNRRMLLGEKVMVTRNGHKVSLKEFAGYSDEQLQDNISELEEITVALEEYLEEDYPVDSDGSPILPISE